MPDIPLVQPTSNSFQSPVNKPTSTMVAGQDTRHRKVSLSQKSTEEPLLKKTEEATALPLSQVSTQKSGRLSRTFSLFSKSKSTKTSKPKQMSASKIKTEFQSKIEEAKGKPLAQILSDMRAEGKSDAEISKILLNTIENGILSQNYVGKKGETGKQLAAKTLDQMLSSLPPTEGLDQGLVIGIALHHIIHLKEVGGNREAWVQRMNGCGGISVKIEEIPEQPNTLLRVTVQKKLSKEEGVQTIKLSPESENLLKLANISFNADTKSTSYYEKSEKTYKNYLMSADEHVLNMMILNKPKLTEEKKTEISQTCRMWTTSSNYPQEYEKACQKEIERQHTLEISLISQILAQSPT